MSVETYLKDAIHPNCYWTDWTPSTSASGTMTFTGVTIHLAKYRIHNKEMSIIVKISGTTGNVASDGIRFTLPYAPADDDQYIPARYLDGGNITVGHASVSTTSSWIEVFRSAGGNWGLGADRRVYVTGLLRIA